MDFFKIIDFLSAKRIIIDGLSVDKQGTVSLPLSEAVGRRSAETIKATERLPDYNRSTVDGYAVKAANTYGATDSVPSMLSLLGKAEMGVVGKFFINSRETVYVPTGGEVPEGADAVVMLEDAEPFSDCIAVYKPITVSGNIISAGDDVELGEIILRKGEIITPLVSGVLAALGIAKIKVFEKIRLAIISTGDEIVEVDKKTCIGQIRDVNTVVCESICKEAGFDVVYKVLVKDGFFELDEAVERAVGSADIVIISGGSSIGARDFTEQVLEKRGKILVHGIAMKPGKPTLIARVDDKMVLGLPGHPMACLLTLKLLVINAINEKYDDKEGKYLQAETSINFPSSPGRTTVQPVKLSFSDKGVTAEPIFYKSGLVSVFSKADGYTLISPKTEGIDKGERIKVYLL